MQYQHRVAWYAANPYRSNVVKVATVLEVDIKDLMRSNNLEDKKTEKIEVKKFFEKNEEAFYITDGLKRFRGVKGYYNDTVRIDKAREQASLTPVPFSKVFFRPK